jgi:hypothetical protein
MLMRGILSGKLLKSIVLEHNVNFVQGAVRDIVHFTDLEAVVLLRSNITFVRVRLYKLEG